MIKATGRSKRETMAVEYETRKPWAVNCGGYEFYMSIKQSKDVKSKPWDEVWMFMCSDTKTNTLKAPPKVAKEPEPSPRELIKEVLQEKHKLHFSQVRQQLKNKGLEVSKRIMGDLMSMMSESGQVEQDGMYYSLKKVS